MSKKRNKNNLDKEFMNELDAAWNDEGSKGQHALTFLILLLIISFIVWASWATVDEITRGQGQIVSSSRTQIISHFEGGILTEMIAKEGQIVEEGEVLARVENVAAESGQRAIQTKIWEHEAAIIRLETARQGLLDKDNSMTIRGADITFKIVPITFPQHLIDNAPLIVQQAEGEYQADAQQVVSEVNVLVSQVKQAQQDLVRLERRLETAREERGLAARRLELARPMVQKKLFPEVEFLNLQSEVVNLRGEVESLENDISKANTGIDEAILKQELLISEVLSGVMADITRHYSELAALEESLTTGSDRVVRTEVRSPMRGTVQRVLIHTRGSTVRSGDPIIEIVPIDTNLLVEAKIRPADIAFIYPNQEAVIKLTAYDYSIYGSLTGYVDQISADTVEGPNNDHFYLVKLQTDQQQLIHNGEVLPIIPGMIASVDILTGKKTIMDYLLKPLLKAKDNALRER